jgi:hypothetical protein
MQYLHHSSLLNIGLGLVSIADATMETKACGLLWNKNNIKAFLPYKRSVEGK